MLYQENVATGKQRYERFVEDFLAVAEFHDATDAYSKGGHKKNLVIVSGMLNSRMSQMLSMLQQSSEIHVEETQELLRVYDADSSPTISKPACKMPSKKSIPSVVSHKSPGGNLHPMLTEGEINLIVNYANEVFLVNGGIDSSDLKGILTGTLSRRLVITKTYILRVLFEYLSLLGQIDSDWMTRICNSGMLLSPSSLWENHDERSLVRQDFYSAAKSLESGRYKDDVRLMHKMLGTIKNLNNK